MLFEYSIKRFDEVLREVWDSREIKKSLEKHNFALAFSHQIEDVIALDMLLQTHFFKENSKFFEAFTLDTKKLFKESLEHQEAVEKHFGIKIKSYSSPLIELERIEKELGEYGMRDSLQKRKKCCYVRKILPLQSALEDKILWISGIRIAQSITRSDTKLLENDDNFGLYKVNPLFDWEDSMLWEYVSFRGIPQNALYKKGFLSIGCTPCTRAVEQGEDIRAGRWWWESADHKECGLHRKDK
ncbi:phosphoadenylyl-sulfate reductase [Helicobacter turcicus]|uniref:Adenosine 5'-phosphosulfate reductase n=1 Tax=Helicobacter turcicus TaxID=2867412 RepID=A0ABS7JKS4_9HELI|nr:phosphoadenylyl-sulfate reductase [Helicobacter turcicus]MBX7489990.1 phosphoadenylyl-sulfate reductase [Helicobacter turcicus]MBX7544849.1 phosphoadenylyl-sulfate reductase [Helicobacter turcicus]